MHGCPHFSGEGSSAFPQERPKNTTRPLRDHWSPVTLCLEPSSWLIRLAALPGVGGFGLQPWCRELNSGSWWQHLSSLGDSSLPRLILLFYFHQFVCVDHYGNFMTHISLPVANWGKHLEASHHVWHLFHLLISHITNSASAMMPSSTSSTLGNKLYLSLEKWTHLKCWDVEAKKFEFEYWFCPLVLLCNI